MVKFINSIIKFPSLGNWMFILFGVVCVVFIFGIVMTIIKKKAYPVGTSTAVATVLAAITLPLIGQIRADGSYVQFTLFVIGCGAILSVIGGVISMIVSKKCKKNAYCEQPSQAKPEPVTDYFSEPAPFDYTSDNIYAAPAPASAPAPDYGMPPKASPYTGGYSAPASAANPEVESLLMKINRICANGAPLPEMRETAMQLQNERAKPENKNNPETYSKLNKALLDLLNVIQKR